MKRLKTGGRVATVTRAQALQARQWMDEGTTMTDAARKLAVSRAGAPPEPGPRGPDQPRQAN